MSEQTISPTRRRQQRALVLAFAGWTYDQIADRLGYRDESGARKAAQAAQDRLGLPEGDGQVRESLLHRSRVLEAEIWEDLAEGNSRAAPSTGAMLKLWEFQAALTGVTGPPAEGSEEYATIDQDIADLLGALSTEDRAAKAK